MTGAVCVTLIFCAPAFAEFKKTKIAVLDFALHGERYETTDMGKIVAEWLITALVKEGRFDVIERRLLEKVLSEQKLGATGLVDEQSASRLGKMLGAKVVITGSLMKFQNVIEANSRIIDVESGAVVAAEIVRSTSTAKLEDLVVQMAEKIIKDFPLEGYIVKRDEQRVLIDLGRRHGVKSGMRFLVFREGNVIKHPKTGEILDIERIETGVIEVGSVNEKTAEASIVSEMSPSTVDYGHQVKSLKEAGAERVRSRIDVRTERPPRAPSAGVGDIASVEAAIDEMKQLRQAGNSEWKRKSKDALKALRALSRTHRKTPELSLANARYYAALENFSEAENHIDLAVRYQGNPTDAYLFQGDMYLEASSRRKGYAKNAVRAYERAAGSTTDRGLQSSLYLKLGNIFADILATTGKAEAYWKKAVDVKPESDAARQARERLSLAARKNER